MWSLVLTVAAVAIAVLIILRLLGAIAVTVYEWEHALLYIDGRFERRLAPGRHFIWPPGHRRLVQRLPAHDQFLSSGLADVLTGDRFALRLSASVRYRITDPRNAIENPYYERLQKGVADALMAAASAQTLDTLIGKRVELGAEIVAAVAPQVPEVEISTAAIGIVLPPEVRRMLTEVERAKFEAQATLERARGEQAALRSLANSARMLKGNPELIALRTLQAVSPTGKGATLVLGQGGLVLPAAES